eukprot:8200110-Ditylum_brightwellii.AAC.1
MFLLHRVIFFVLTILHYGQAFSPTNLHQKTVSKEYRTKGFFEDATKEQLEESCHNTKTKLDEGRRRVAFAMIGSLWSVGSAFSSPEAANAVYGQDANIALPNVVEGMNNRVTQQCLVESLGNRECLVYLDPENKLYQGADTRILLERVEKSTEALATIPELIDAKKWLAIVGVLTGPMGTLVRSMDQLSKLSQDPSCCIP